jgi:putative phosphoesterase
MFRQAVGESARGASGLHWEEWEMRVGIVSDTHGHVELARPAVRMFEGLEVDHVLHCGDIGSTEIVELFEQWPTDYVFGNCDTDQKALEAAIESAGQTCHGEFGEFELEGVSFALVHSHEPRRFAAAVGSGRYQVVCYGHTHVASIEHTGDTLVINPGAIYRAKPHSVALLELPELKAMIIGL